MTKDIEKCTKCKTILILGENWTEASKKYKKYKCNPCYNKYTYNWQKENKSKVKKIRQKHTIKHKDKLSEYNHQWVLDNPDYHKTYRKNNKGYINAKTVKRRAAKLNATPTWLTQFDLDYIRNLYIQATELKRITSEQHEVHHITPLQFNPSTSGLHVPWNLEILTKSDHIKKHTKYGDEV